MKYLKLFEQDFDDPFGEETNEPGDIRKLYGWLLENVKIPSDHRFIYYDDDDVIELLSCRGDGSIDIGEFYFYVGKSDDTFQITYSYYPRLTSFKIYTHSLFVKLTNKNIILKKLKDVLESIKNH